MYYGIKKYKDLPSFLYILGYIIIIKKTDEHTLDSTRG